MFYSSNHLIADNVWRSEPFLQRLLGEGWANMDKKVNLIELAKTQSALDDVRKANPGANLSDVIHSSGHKFYDDLVTKTLEKSITELLDFTGKSDWKSFTKDEMLRVLKKTLNLLRNTFMNEPDKLPKKKDGTLGFIPKEGRNTA